MSVDKTGLNFTRPGAKFRTLKKKEDIICGEGLWFWFSIRARNSFQQNFACTCKCAYGATSPHIKTEHLPKVFKFNIFSI